MTKPVLKKLTVKKEKLRTLTPTELSDVVGGTEAASPQSTGTICLDSIGTEDCF